MMADWGSFFKGFGIGLLTALIIGVIIALIIVIPMLLGKFSGLPSWIPFIGKKSAEAAGLFLILKKK